MPGNDRIMLNVVEYWSGFFSLLITIQLKMDGRRGQGMEEAAKFCEADGFLVQYCETIWLLFALSICVVLFFKVLEVATSWNYVDNIAKKARQCTFTCCKEINKLEVALVVLIFTVPLLYDWIPFITNSYGPIGLWCWIRTLNNDCSTQIA